MADLSMLSSLVSNILGKLSPLATQELGLIWGFKDDLSALEGYFKGIQDVLQDAEFQTTRRNDQNSFESWLRDLRAESLKMENVLDEVLTEDKLRELHKELAEQSCIIYDVIAFFSYNIVQLIFRFRIAHQVKAIRKNIADIALRRSQLSFNPSAVNYVVEEVEGEMPNRETSSLILSSLIYGRDEEMEMVIQKICNPGICITDMDDIRVFAIWGMGGLGKTTLAQLVYNHARVGEYFELKCWLYVSVKFQVKELIRGIIESIDESKYKLSQLDIMQLHLQDRLRGKRFLIVLDDVWIEESEKRKWEQLSRTLSCGAEGSIVLLTTRIETTSRMTAKYPELRCELSFLSEEDSWSLFEKLAFAEGRDGGERRELEPIGKEIVKKCGGLPLAVKTLGGLMWSKSGRSEWERVKSSEAWELQDSDILPALKLNYDNLFPHLKRCFAYCCLFPKGYRMEKSKLIELWLSNGLIPTRGGEANWYVVGEEIINCLLWKSFFQLHVMNGVRFEYELYDYGELYKMHYLMHDLAQYVMIYDCLVIEPGRTFTIPNEVLHLSCSSGLDLSHDLENQKSLRSIFIFSNLNYEGSIRLIFNNMYLRVLYFDGIRVSTLPESICKLKHLRYLNLSNSSIEVLPESIVYLQNLQVLVVDSCDKLRELPKGMRYMKNLQHLHNETCTSLTHFPVEIKELTSLRTISEFSVSDIQNAGAQIGELGDLNLLGGDLILFRLEKVGGFEAATRANMKNKTEISCLTFEWWYDQPVSDRLIMPAHEDVLEGLEPNQSLKVLRIRNYMGSSISPRWMVNLRNLVEIKFWRCRECKYIAPLGKFPSLRVIKIYVMPYLKSFDNDDNSKSADSILFPSLQELYVKRCDNLVSLPTNIGNLKKLVIGSCKSLLSLPHGIQSFKYLKQLEIYNCERLRKKYHIGGEDWQKISHIPNVSIRKDRFG